MSEKQDFRHENLDTLGKRAKVLIDKGDKSQEKAHEFYVSAGLHLNEARKRCTKEGTKWGEWLGCYAISSSTAHRHMQIAGGVIDLDALRAADAERKRASRASKSPGRPGRNGHYNPVRTNTFCAH